jgi:hypothetical protein
LQETIRESARGGPHVQADATAGIQAEDLQRMEELHPTPADEGMGRAGDGEWCVPRNERPRLLEPAVPGADLTRQDQADGLLPAGAQAALDQEEVNSVAGSLLRHTSFTIRPRG